MGEKQPEKTLITSGPKNGVRSELATQTLAHYGEDNQHLTAVELTIDSYPVTADILPIALAPGEDLFFEIPGVYPSFYGVYKSKGNGYQLWAGGTPPPSGQQPVG